MKAEKNAGTKALAAMAGNASTSGCEVFVRKLIEANAGGPYGSEVLHVVQAEGDLVWDRVKEGRLARGWKRACIDIVASDNGWTAKAAGPNSTVFAFE